MKKIELWYNPKRNALMYRQDDDSGFTTTSEFDIILSKQEMLDPNSTGWFLVGDFD